MRKRVALQVVRDIAVLAFGVFLASAGYSQMNRELVFVVLLGIGVALVVLTLIELLLLARKTKRKAYFYFNAIIQLPPLFIIAGLLGIVGVALLVLNVIIIVVLKREKTSAATASKA